MKTKSWTFRYRWGLSLEINLEVWVLIPTIIVTSKEIAVTWLCALFQVDAKRLYKFLKEIFDE